MRTLEIKPPRSTPALLLPTLVTPGLLRRHIIVHVDPSICGKLGSLFDCQGLMEHAMVLGHWVRIEDARP